LKLVRNVARVVEYPPSNFGYSFWLFDYSFPIYGLLGVARVDRLSVGGRGEAIDRSASCTLLLLTQSKLTNSCFFGDKVLDLESDFRKLGSFIMLRSLIRILRASLVQNNPE